MPHNHKALSFKRGQEREAECICITSRLTSNDVNEEEEKQGEILAHG